MQRGECGSMGWDARWHVVVLLQLHAALMLTHAHWLPHQPHQSILDTRNAKSSTLIWQPKHDERPFLFFPFFSFVNNYLF